MNESHSLENRPETVAEDDPDLGRREALEKLGKLAGYTAPVALTLLLMPKRAVAGCGSCQPSP